jgi:molybdopterin-guanine dinucleotide biosynthesis protein A
MTTDPVRAAIVLAGGRSSRFGRDKLAEPVDGERLLDRAITAVRQVVDVVLVVVAPGDRRPLPDGVTRVHDEAAFEGPLAGVAAGLRAVPRTVERAILVGGDMPAIVPAVLEALLAALDDPAVDAAVLHDGDRRRPLPSAVRLPEASTRADELLAAGERRLRALIDRPGTVDLGPERWRRLDPTGDTLRDVDIPADL